MFGMVKEPLDESECVLFELLGESNMVLYE